MDSLRQISNRSNPEEEDVRVDESELSGLSRWLWCKPINPDGAVDDEDEEIVALQEEYSDQEAFATNSCFQRTTSKAIHPESSSSDRIWQSTRLSAKDYSTRTINIRSRTFEYSTSRKPLQLCPAPLLTSWTPVANSLRSNQNSENSRSQETHQRRGLLGKLMGKSGKTPRRTSSSSSIKGTEIQELPGHY